MPDPDLGVGGATCWSSQFQERHWVNASESGSVCSSRESYPENNSGRGHKECRGAVLIRWSEVAPK